MDEMIRSCAHTHTTYCDGRSGMDEMAARARELGFVSLGFSSHAVQTFDRPYCVPKAQEADYLNDVERVKRQYEGVMRVWRGCERDLYSCAEVSKYEYFIASSHYMPSRNGFTCVDGDGSKLRTLIDEEFGGDGDAFAERYYTAFALYILAYSPPIIGHFDIVRKNAAQYNLFDEDGARCREAALSALEIAAKTGAVLEVNTGKVLEDARRQPYPRPYLLKRWRELGGEVMVNSDCHDARFLDRAYDRMPDYLTMCGFDSVCRLGSGDELFERVKL